MRGGDATGRFDAEFETHSNWEGMSRDLQRPVGQRVFWYRYDPDATTVDPIYDVGSPQGGRVYKNPIDLPVINAFMDHGEQYETDRGLYMVDTLKLFINYDDIQRHLPDLPTNPDIHMKDRVIFRNEVFAPFNINQRGQIAYDYMTLSVMLRQMKPEELYNDDWTTYAPTWLVGTSVGVQELGNYGDGGILEQTKEP